ncbi:effector-associated constant component EACC1 [Nocardia xishanensis]
MIKLQLSISGAADPVQELHSLYSELVGDNDLMRAKVSLLTAPQRPGDMGVEEVIRMLVEPGLVAAVSSCITAWITRRAHLRIIVEGPSGSADISVDGHIKPAIVDSVTRAIESAVGSSGDEASG